MDMDLYSHDLMYKFHAKDLTQTEALKQYADHTVKEIKSTYGWDTNEADSSTFRETRP
jgi:hypothetical protein